MKNKETIEIRQTKEEIKPAPPKEHVLLDNKPAILHEDELYQPKPLKKNRIQWE